MKLTVFDTHAFDRAALTEANRRFGHELVFFEPRLSRDTARMAEGSPAVCPFVNDHVDAPAITLLAEVGVQLIAVRAAGFNNIDIAAAQEAGVRVVRVPEYSPHAVAEHVFAILLSLVRKIHRAYARVREGNFKLDGLVGFDLHGKTFGVVGTGRIGRCVARIARGFGCRVLAQDVSPDAAWAASIGVEYVDLDTLYARSDIISLNVPLTRETLHLVDARAIQRMKAGVILLNAGRGALVDTRALIDGLKRRHIGGAGLDVYEEEEGIFFRDLSDQVLGDDVLARLLTFPNVLVTSHQGFLTHEALANIAETTLASVSAFERGEPLIHEVRLRPA